MDIGRRQLLGMGAAGLAASAVRPAAARAQAKGKVRLAYLQLGWAATEIIHKEDLLGKRGWAADYSIVPGAPGPLLNQLASRNVDAIDMSFALAAKAFEDGVPLRVTGVATAVLGAIVARKDAGLGRVEDLKGRKVAAVVGTSTFFDIRALTLKGYGFDLQKDTQIVTATAPPDMVTMLGKKEVDAIIAWQPITDAVVLRGEGVYLAKQIDLWRKATGRATGFPVHVCYLVHADYLAAQPRHRARSERRPEGRGRHLVRQAERAMEIVAEVTKLPHERHRGGPPGDGPHALRPARRAGRHPDRPAQDQQGVRLPHSRTLGQPRPHPPGILPPGVSEIPRPRVLGAPPLPTAGRALALVLLAWSLLSWRYGPYVLRPWSVLVGLRGDREDGRDLDAHRRVARPHRRRLRRGGRGVAPPGAGRVPVAG